MPLRNLWHDLSQAARRLRRSPTYAIFSIVTLGLGIGVAAAVCPAMYVLALRSSGLDDRNLAVLGCAGRRAARPGRRVGLLPSGGARVPGGPQRGAPGIVSCGVLPYATRERREGFR